MKNHIKSILLKALVIALILSVGGIIGTVVHKQSLFPENETTAELVTLVPEDVEESSLQETLPESTTAAPVTTAADTTTVPGYIKHAVIDFSNISIIDLMPLSLASGSWDAKHCQGIAVDREKRYIYYSYTTAFVKCDFEGNVVGTIKNIKGHLGDICLNKQDGKVYASYNPPGKKALYTAIIDVDGLNKVGLDAVSCGLIRTVHLKDVFSDYSATVTVGAGQKKARYGVSGTDGICFGPSFKTGGGNYLTVACGIAPEPDRTDNDYQILLQYDVTLWWSLYSRPLSYTSYHKIGPACNGKYFIYTGNTNYGVQTLSYFSDFNVWLLNCYATTKSSYNKYTLFVVDGDVPPKQGTLIGQTTTDNQQLLTLYADGDYDAAHGIYGWYSEKGNLGMDYMGDGLFYIIHPYSTWYGTETAVAYLYVWDPSQKSPFTIAAGISSDYVISKKITS